MTDMVIPDGIEPVLAIRAWHFNDGLRSLNGTVWNPGEPLKAECHRCKSFYWDVGQLGSCKACYTLEEAFKVARAFECPLPDWHRTVVLPPGMGFMLCVHDEPEYGLPSEICTCGIYAGSLEGLYDTGRLAIPDLPCGDVYGTVNLWGKIIPGTKGYRAEYAYPAEFVVPSRITEEQRATLAEFGVPITVSDDRKMLIGRTSYGSDLYVRFPPWVGNFITVMTPSFAVLTKPAVKPMPKDEQNAMLMAIACVIALVIVAIARLLTLVLS